MGSFKQTWVKILIVVILVLVVGSTAAYLFGRSKSQPISLSQPTLSITPEPDTALIALPQNDDSLYADPTFSKILFSTSSGDELIWNTFANNNLGIKFIYPSNYTIPLVMDNQIRLLREYGSMFEIKRIDTDETLEQWKSTIVGYRVSSATFHTYPAYYFATNQTGQTPMDFYAVKIHNSIYTIAFESGSYVQPPEKSVLDKILNSIAF